MKVEVSWAAVLIWVCGAVAAPGIWGACGAALAAHELAHLAAMKALGIGVEKIRLCVTGMEITRGRELTSYARDAAASMSGPAASLALGAAAYAAGGAVLRAFGVASVMLGALNALPVAGLDGGAALSAILARRMPPDRVTAVMRPISLTFTVALWLAAVFLMLASGSGFSLFALAAALFFAQLFDLRRE